MFGSTMTALTAAAYGFLAFQFTRLGVLLGLVFIAYAIDRNPWAILIAPAALGALALATISLRSVVRLARA